MIGVYTLDLQPEANPLSITFLGSGLGLGLGLGLGVRIYIHHFVTFTPTHIDKCTLFL